MALSAQTVTTTFKDSTAPGWVFGGTGYTPNLTSGGIDPNGDGWLRLTDNGQNRATYAYYDTSLSSANRTIFTSVDFASYNGSGADGLGFFIFDASVPFGIGAAGGSLGFAQKTGVDGMDGGYIGIGFDDFGNFSNPTEGRIDGPGFIANSVAVRGPGSGQTGYSYLGGTTDLSAAPYGLGQMDFPGSITRPGQTGVDFRHFELILTPTNQLSVYLQFGFAGALTKVLELDLSAYTRPEDIKFGFFAGTGDSTDIHEIRSFTMATVVSNLWDNSGGTSTWGSAANWNPDFLPAFGADILFNNQFVSSAQTIDVGAAQNRTVRALTFDAPFNYTLNNGTLTFNNNGTPGTYGISASQLNGSAATAHTINSAVVLANNIYTRNSSAAELKLNGTVNLGSHTLSAEGTGHTSIGGVVSGTGSITKIETGKLTLSGNNTYSGGTTLTAGTIAVAHNNALGSGGLVINGGTLAVANDITSNITLGNAITLQGNASLANLSNNSSPIYTFTTSGNITQTDGSYTLGLTNTTISGNVALSNNTTNRTLTTQVDTGTSTISGVIANGGGSTTGSLTKTGSGELVLSGANTYTGTTTISDGIVTLGANNRLADTSSVSIGSSGSLNLNGKSEQIGTLTALGGGATLDFGTTSGANTFVFGNYVAPPSGVLVVNNYEMSTDTFATTVASQNVSTIYISGYGVAQEAGSTSSTLYGSAYLLTPITATYKEWDGSSSAAWNTANNWTTPTKPSTTQVALFGSLGTARPNVTLDGANTIAGIKFDAAATTSYNISGANALTLTGTVPYIQQQDNNSHTISVNSLVLGANTVADITNSGNLTISSVISGSGRSLIRDGDGTGKLILSGANTFTGGLFANQGIVQISNSAALGTGAATIAGGATLELAGNITASNAITVAGDGVGGNGAIRNISGNNTLSGALTLTNHTEFASDAGTLTSSGAISGAGKNITVTGAGNTTFSGAITTGTGATFTAESTGTVTLSGTTANTFTGTTTVKSGTLVLNKTAGVTAIAGNITVGDGTGTDTLRLGANNQIADTTHVTLAAGAVFDVNGKTETIGNLLSSATDSSVTLGAAGNLTVTVSNANNDNYAGTFTGTNTSALNKAGTGTLTLTTASAGFLGNTNVNAGNLSLQNGQAAGTGLVTVASGAKTSVQGGITVANNFSINGLGTGGSDGAIENTAGTNTLTGTIALTGNSRIRATTGTLNVNGAISGTNRNLTVGGTGNINVNAGITLGTGSLTKTDGGTTVLNNATSFTGGVTVAGGTLQLGASNIFNAANTVAVDSGATFLVGSNAQTLVGLTGAGTTTFTTGGNLSLTGISTYAGNLTGTGTLTLSSGSALTLDTSISNTSLDLVLAGGTLNLADPAFSFGKLSVTANSTIDFGGGNINLSLLNLDVASGVVLTITNWQNSLDALYTQAWVGGVPDVRGISPSNRVNFVGYGGSGNTIWQDFDKQVTPVPEPSTYGAIFLACATGVLFWRRQRKAKRG